MPSGSSLFPDQHLNREISIVTTIAFSAVAFLIVVSVTKLICGGIRVDGRDERTGLDSALHGEWTFEIE